MKGEYFIVSDSPEAWLSNKRWRYMMNNEVYTKKVTAIPIDKAHWEVGLAQWTSITPSTSTTNVVCGLSFSRSQPDFEGFFRALRFPPSSDSTRSLIHLAVVLCSEVIHGSCSGAERLAGYTAPSIRPR